jgi:hypothetical protein
VPGFDPGFPQCKPGNNVNRLNFLPTPCAFFHGHKSLVCMTVQAFNYVLQSLPSVASLNRRVAELAALISDTVKMAG